MTENLELEVLNPDQKIFTSKQGNTYVFQTPDSNATVLQIIDALELTGDALKMSSSFPLLLKHVVIKPQDLTIESEVFKGAEGIKELMEVCSEAVRFLTSDS